MRILVFALLLTIFAAAPARADMAIAPLRAVLDADHREARFVVSNPTRRILEGNASWLDLTATETGYAPASTGDRQRLSAAPYFTLEPAHFRLEPGARVDIIVRLRDGSPPPGERRSHLLVETAAARTLIRKASQQGLQADMSAAVSVPVILRGDGRARAEIGETRLLRDSDGMLLLATTIEPEGGHSTYGGLTAHFHPTDAGDIDEFVVTRDNVAAYPDAAGRRVELPLGYFSLGGGELTLRYEGAGEYAGKLFDERRFDIAPSE